MKYGHQIQGLREKYKDVFVAGDEKGTKSEAKVQEALDRESMALTELKLHRGIVLDDKNHWVHEKTKRPYVWHKPDIPTGFNPTEDRHVTGTGIPSAPTRPTRKGTKESEPLKKAEHSAEKQQEKQKKDEEEDEQQTKKKKGHDEHHGSKDEEPAKKKNALDDLLGS